MFLCYRVCFLSFLVVLLVRTFPSLVLRLGASRRVSSLLRGSEPSRHQLTLLPVLPFGLLRFWFVRVDIVFGGKPKSSNHSTLETLKVNLSLPHNSAWNCYEGVQETKSRLTDRRSLGSTPCPDPCSPACSHRLERI